MDTVAPRCATGSHARAAKSQELRFGAIVHRTGLRDAEVARALEYLKRDHLVRARTKDAQGSRIILAYSMTVRGQAAWDAVQGYGRAIRERGAIFGPEELAAVDRALAA